MESLLIKPVSFTDINSLANTTITKVPAVRAVTAKTVENMPHGLSGMKHDDYPPGFGGGSAILDTYLQYIGENVFGKTIIYVIKFSYFITFSTILNKLCLQYCNLILFHDNYKL